MADAQGHSGRTRAWLWALGGLVVVLAIALVVVLVTRDDDSDEAATTTTTSSALPSVSGCVPLPPITDDPQSYAEHLFAAWQNDDHTAAANVASTDAVNELFARPYPAQGPYTFASCGPAAGSLYCTWNGQNGATLQMQVRTLTGGLPIQVTNVEFS